jgi:hypothetical protein
LFEIFTSEINAPLLRRTLRIITIDRLETVFDICQHVRSRCVVGTWRIPNESLDLLSYFTALLKINQRMPVHFDYEIGLGGQVERGKVKV